MNSNNTNWGVIVNVPMFTSDPNVTVPKGIYHYFMSDFSGWNLVRGDHIRPNSHSYTYRKAGGSGEMRYDASPYWIGWHRVGAAYPLSYPTEVNRFLYDDALDKLYGKIRGDLDLSIDAFQARQTARGFKAGELISDFFKEANKKPWYISSLSQRLLGPIARLTGKARLAWVYGWKPLIEDYHAVLDESLRDYINHFQTYNGSAFSQYGSTCTGTVGSGPTDLVSYKTKVTQVVKMSITMDTTKMPEMANWTSLNPASIGWELLPYSFVIDWFINVGGALRNLETALAYNNAFQSGYITSFIRVEGDSNGGSYRSGPYDPVVTCNGNFWFRYVKMRREVLTRLPLPQPPVWHPKLGVGRLLNGLSLITSLKVANGRPRK